MESGILHLENIGGLKGDNSFKFKKGSLNIVEAPNSSGKTSIVKALAIYSQQRIMEILNP